jgi:hypothetical protein
MLHRYKPIRPGLQGRGVKAAQRTFNPQGVGSSPSGPTRIGSRHTVDR